MSLLKIEITEQHLKLLKHLKWSICGGNFLVAKQDEDGLTSFGGSDLYEEMGFILNGKPENFIPLDAEDFVQYTDEEKKAFDKLYQDLPYVIEIILQTQSFEVGLYKSKHYDRVWTRS